MIKEKNEDFIPTVVQGSYPSFSFSFQLPLDIPSSFNSAIEKVKYCMTARAKISGLEFDLVSGLQFTVNRILDLNKDLAFRNNLK